MNATGDGVCVVLGVPGGTIDASTVESWARMLGGLARPWELIVVGSKSQPVTSDSIRWLELPAGMEYGTGLVLRLGLAASRSPLVVFADTAYPYTPADLPSMLERIEAFTDMPDPKSGEWIPRRPDLVAGCRTGVPVPQPLRFVGGCIRTFARWILGLPLQPLPGWYGFGEHVRAWRAWIEYGNPLNDPHAAFKLFRRSFLERFPIQSDGDFVHIELVGKATFLTCVMDEKALSPKPDRFVPVRWAKKDRAELNRRPKFWKAPVGTL